MRIFNSFEIDDAQQMEKRPVLVLHSSYCSNSRLNLFPCVNSLGYGWKSETKTTKNDYRSTRRRFGKLKNVLLKLIARDTVEH